MEATFYIGRPTNGRWTARAAQQFVGRSVRYGRLGKVGTVERAVAVGSGRAVRLHVALTRNITNPDRAKFRLYVAEEGR